VSAYAAAAISAAENPFTNIELAPQLCRILARSEPLPPFISEIAARVSPRFAHR
jgi:hypothetical protein